MSLQNSFDCVGHDTSGQRFDSISDLWDQNNSPLSWYGHSEAYWDKQTADVEGMLGGLDELHENDIRASRDFLSHLPQVRPFYRVLDVGAGIGRVSKHLLAPFFYNVDLLEQNLGYAQESHAYLSECESKIRHRIVCPMQEFRSRQLTGRDGTVYADLRREYDVIWIQWCVIYLTDEHFIQFLKQCCEALVPNGFIVIKDNVARSGFLVDESDSSVMRSDRYMRSLFQRASMRIVKHARQRDFPRGVHPVRMYALQPLVNLSNAPSESVNHVP